MLTGNNISVLRKLKYASVHALETFTRAKETKDCAHTRVIIQPTHAVYMCIHLLLSQLFFL